MGLCLSEAKKVCRFPVPIPRTPCPLNLALSRQPPPQASRMGVLCGELFVFASISVNRQKLPESTQLYDSKPNIFLANLTYFSIQYAIMDL